MTITPRKNNLWKITPRENSPPPPPPWKITPSLWQFTPLDNHHPIIYYPPPPPKKKKKKKKKKNVFIKTKLMNKGGGWGNFRGRGEGFNCPRGYFQGVGWGIVPGGGQSSTRIISVGYCTGVSFSRGYFLVGDCPGVIVPIRSSNNNHSTFRWGSTQKYRMQIKTRHRYTYQYNPVNHLCIQESWKISLGVDRKLDKYRKTQKKNYVRSCIIISSFFLHV